MALAFAKATDPNR